MFFEVSAEGADLALAAQKVWPPNCDTDLPTTGPQLYGFFFYAFFFRLTIAFLRIRPKREQQRLQKPNVFVVSELPR